MNPIRYMRYLTKKERGTGTHQDTGTLRREYELEQRQMHRTSVHGASGYLGYTRRVETDLGTMYEALVQLRPHGHLSLGHYDSDADAIDAVREWDE